MHGISRRTLLAGGALGGLGVGVSPYLRDYTMALAYETPRVRFEATSPEGKEMLNSYAAGVADMKARPESDPLSWTFQWYTHWVGANTSKEAEIDRVFGAADSPAKMLALAMWDTCRGHITWSNEQDWFSPWHRMYLLFFEEILRITSGNPDFTLPYWDYTSVGRRALPEEFRMQGDATFGSLFVAARNPGVNDGTPLDQSPLYPQLQQGIGRDPLGLDCLDIIEYRNVGFAQGFNASLDTAPHGMVHVLVGDGTNMGSVPFAASDPIFWIHHSNVDRIWASWTAAADGREPPSDAAWNDMMFTFADGSGAETLAKTSDFLTTDALGYSYQDLLVAPGSAIRLASAGARSGAEVATDMAEGKEVALGTEPARVQLDLPQQADARLRSTGAGAERLYLVLRNLQTNVQPGVLYSVYLGGADDDGLFVGAINFFDALPAGREAPAEGGRFFSFDVTDAMDGLRQNGTLPETPEVSIAPTGAPASEAQPVVGEVFFALQ
ncbi:MAG: tyrosinase family protein [Pseudomonadota bacterium]